MTFHSVNELESVCERGGMTSSTSQFASANLLLLNNHFLTFTDVKRMSLKKRLVDKLTKPRQATSAE